VCTLLKKRPLYLPLGQKTAILCLNLKNALRCADGGHSITTLTFFTLNVDRNRLFLAKVRSSLVLILSSFKIVIIFNDKSAEIKVIIENYHNFEKLRIEQLCSKNERTLYTHLISST
jgi:hypothetical protein